MDAVASFTEGFLCTRPGAVGTDTWAVFFTPHRIRRVWGALGAIGIQRDDTGCGVGWEEASPASRGGGPGM